MVVLVVIEVTTMMRIQHTRDMLQVHYTLSHPENDRDVTDRVQEYTLQDASCLRQSRCSFLNAWENTKVARTMTSVFLRNTRWRHGRSRGETKYRPNEWTDHYQQCINSFRLSNSVHWCQSMFLWVTLVVNRKLWIYCSWHGRECTVYCSLCGTQIHREY